MVCSAIIQSGPRQGQRCNRQNTIDGRCREYHAKCASPTCRKLMRMFATNDFLPFCCFAHQNPNQTDVSLLRLDQFRAKVLDDLEYRYVKCPYTNQNLSAHKEVEHILELQTHRDALDRIGRTHRKIMIPFVRDNLANNLCNLALTNPQVNRAKFDGVYACSEAFKAGTMNDAANRESYSLGTHLEHQMSVTKSR